LAFGGIGRTPGHVAQDGAFGDLEAELLDHAVDARRAPRRIRGGHAVQEGTDVGACARSSSAATRFPAQVPPEANAMATDDGLGLDDGERLLSTRPPAAKAQPEKAVDDEKAWSGVLPLEDGKLPAEREVLDHEVGATGEARKESPGNGKSAVEHPRTMPTVETEGNRAHPRAIRVS
jgi:hypothetical protein